jgi:hypothetical protein
MIQLPSLSLLGMLASVIELNVAIASVMSGLLLVAAVSVRSILN